MPPFPERAALAETSVDADAPGRRTAPSMPSKPLSRRFEKSFDAAGQGAAAFNRKIHRYRPAEPRYGFDLAKSLAGAKTLTDMVELQTAFWRKQFGTLYGSSRGSPRAVHQGDGRHHRGDAGSHGARRKARD